MSLPLKEDVLQGTDPLNRAQSRLVSERRCQGARCTPVVESGLLRVLIVDDDRDTTDVLSMLVQRWGHDPQRAYDGVAALRVAAFQRPDVVLMDIAMPHLDGCQVAERLRCDTCLRDCFQIGITGYADSATRLRCRKAGIDLLLIKPVDSSVLETVLYLESARLGRAREATLTGRTPSFSAAGVLAAARLDVVPRSAATTAVSL